MRACLLAAIVTCSGCSLIYNTNELRNHPGDGGAADGSTTDSGPRDARVDSGCVLPTSTPRPTSVSWDELGVFHVEFNEPATSDVNYVVSVGEATQGFTLSAGESTSLLQLFVPLFRTTNTLTVIYDGLCPQVLADYPVDTTLDYAGAANAGAWNTTLHALHEASMDIADDGTVVFEASALGEAVSVPVLDHLYLWPLEEVPHEIITAPTDASIAGPRISDDARFITYWMGNWNGGGETAGNFYYFGRDGALPTHGMFTPGTDRVSSDLRLGADGMYGFAMVDAQPHIRMVTFSSTVLAPTIDTMDTAIVGYGPILQAVAPYSVAYVSDPRDAGTPTATPTDTTDVVQATGCTVNGGVGLVTVDDTNIIAFVGECGSDSALFQTSSGTSRLLLDPRMTGVDGLLAADRSGEVFLLRKSASGDVSGGFWIFDSGFSGAENMQPLRTDLAMADPAPTFSPLLDGAALSPNGEWAVFAWQAGASSTSGTTEFQLVRIRVR